MDFLPPNNDYVVRHYAFFQCIHDHLLSKFHKNSLNIIRVHEAPKHQCKLFRVIKLPWSPNSFFSDHQVRSKVHIKILEPSNMKRIVTTHLTSHLVMLLLPLLSLLSAHTIKPFFAPLDEAKIIENQAKPLLTLQHSGLHTTLTTNFPTYKYYREYYREHYVWKALSSTSTTRIKKCSR